MLMPIGKYKGQSVAAMKSSYLAWLISNDSIRHNRWPLILEALIVLRDRFSDFDALVSEMIVNHPPPAHWRSPARERRRSQEKAEKLTALEVRRAEEKRERRKRFQAQLEEERKRLEELHRTDGYYVARQAKQSEPARGIR